MRVINVIYILIVFNFIYPFFVRYIGLPYIKGLYVNSIIFALFVYSLLMGPFLGLSRVQSNKVVSKYKIMFFALLSLLLFSSLFNYNHWFVLIKSIVEIYFPYIVLFLIITRIKLSKNEEVILIKLCYILIILQIPVVLIQYFIGGYSTADSMSGTVSFEELGGTGINGVLGAFLFSVCMSRIAITKINPGFLLLGLSAFVPSIFGGSRFGIILMGVVVIVLIISLIWVGDAQGVRGIARSFGLIVIMTIILYGVFVYLVPKNRFAEYLDFNLLTSRQEVLEYDSDQGSQRILGYEILNKFVFKNWNDILFGLGSGATIGSKEVGAKANKIFLNYFPVGAPDGIYFMLTIGAIGLMLVTIILVYGIFWVQKYLQIETCLFMRMNGYAFISITVACLLSIHYTLVWSSQIGLTYWVLAGVLVNRYGEVSTISNGYPLAEIK